MASDERSRHALYTRLQDVLGEEHAVALMEPSAVRPAEHLPPTGWGEGARKQDVERLGERLDARIDALEERMALRLSEAVNGVKAELLDKMVSQTRTMVFATLGAVTTVAALVFAAA